MIRKCTLFFVLSLFSLGTLSAPVHGDVRETGDSKGYNPSFTPQDRNRFLQALE